MASVDREHLVAGMFGIEWVLKGLSRSATSPKPGFSHNSAADGTLGAV